MRVTTKHTYAASPAQVLAMLTDSEFLESLFAGAETRRHKVSVDGTKTSATATMDAPSQTRRFTGPEITATLTINWGQPQADGSCRGPITVDLYGLPARVSGIATISPVAPAANEASAPEGSPVEQTTVTYDANFTISIPFVGGKLEAAAAPHVMQVINEQQPRGRAYLAAKSAE